jgi:hypothetical protein
MVLTASSSWLACYYLTHTHTNYIVLTMKPLCKYACIYILRYIILMVILFQI